MKLLYPDLVSNRIVSVPESRLLCDVASQDPRESLCLKAPLDTRTELASAKEGLVDNDPHRLTPRASGHLELLMLRRKVSRDAEAKFVIWHTKSQRRSY
jgi:hypothetical protein